MFFAIGVRTRWNDAVIRMLREQGYDHYIESLDGIEYIGEKDKDRSVRAVLQITTQIGCRIACRYCPQELFTKEYSKKRHDHKMSLSIFRNCLNHVPDDTIIEFAGFSEPFFNPDCIEMIKYADNMGYDIELFTTLEGLTFDGFMKIKDISFREVVLHIPDENRNSNIEPDDEYCELLRMVLDARKRNGDPFVDWCSCHGKMDGRVESILNGRYRVL